ncbi:MAG: ABC transporter permease [Phycisphaerae bacterium]|nr:ABC transporter permease [Phycisphaerae bacterium]
MSRTPAHAERRRRALAPSRLWIAFTLALALLAPVIANSRPIVLDRLDASGRVISREYPLAASLLGEALTPLDFAEREERNEVRATFTLVPFSPNERAGDRKASFLPPGAAASAGRTHLLGTDRHGQDVLSNLIHGSRLAISVGLIAAGLATLIGIVLGAFMGYFGGWVDTILSRLVEVVMGVPLLFVLVLAAGVMPRSIEATMALIACFTWTTAARFTRAEFMRLRNADYVLAARAAGIPMRSLLFRHMLRNAAAPVLIDASFTMATAVVLEATLSYLGLGPPDRASWGALLASATSDAGEFRWWLAAFPGAAIFLTALSYNIMGESARDELDPRAA